MNILDENIGEDQREKLRRYKIRFRHIGTDIGRSGIDDTEQVIPMLLTLKQPTLYTRDRRFVQEKYRHDKYALVHLDVPPSFCADAIRRLQKDKRFNTSKKRLGQLIRVGSNSIILL
jgi:hypothetical protein